MPSERRAYVWIAWIGHGKWAPIAIERGDPYLILSSISTSFAPESIARAKSSTGLA